jgi:internalin A
MAEMVMSAKARPLNEIKLILTGRGGAGKTSIVQALLGQPFDPGAQSTSDIVRSDWDMAGCKKAAVTAHIWDFSRSMISHGLHQIFFSVRNLYVVVLTAGNNAERDKAQYWLRQIKAFATDGQGQGPPVIVALNKWDVEGSRPDVDCAALRRDFPFIREFIELDCRSNRGVTKLRTALCRTVDSLAWVREPFPQSWDKVRLALINDSAQRPHLSYAQYRMLCIEHNVNNEIWQGALAEILHQQGAALNYRTSPRLREATILQPEWLTTNAQALIRRAERQKGVLKQTDIDSVLRKESDPAMRRYLTHIMERFGIVHRTEGDADTDGDIFWRLPQGL